VIRVVLADDHPLFVEAMRHALAPEFHLVAVALTLARIVPTIATHHPDVCLLDRHFDDGDGLGIIGPIHAASPGTRVVVLTGDPGEGVEAAARRAGASDCVHKTCGLHAVNEAIRSGRHQAPPTTTAVRQRRDPAPDPVAAAELTRRERECLVLVAGGLTSGAIARRLALSPTTVRGHVQSVLTKLGVHSRLEAALIAHRAGLVGPMDAT
jgi:two-component system, NarL family, nitrate/nitrite response regulator NarL